MRAMAPAGAFSYVLFLTPVSSRTRSGAVLSVSIDLGISGLADAEEVGRGGFGVGYRARQVAVGRSVAVKMLSAVSLSEETRRRFERECKAMAAVSSHPNIVALYDSGMAASGRPYIVMEYVPGGSLAERMPLVWAHAIEVGVKMAGALETAHRIGIFHRDVKPENILLSSYGEPKLTDFGVAKVAESSETPSGNITASILHAAPETLSGVRPSATTDVYSLASTLYALIAGRAPFAGDNEETLAPLLTRIMLADAPNLRQYDVPDAISAAVEHALAKDPNDRPQSPAEFGRRLASAQKACGLTPTEMLIEGVERTGATVVPQTGKDDRATQPRNRDAIAAALPQIPAQEPRAGAAVEAPPVVPAQPTPPSVPDPAKPSGSRKRAVVAAGVSVALLAGGATATILTSGGSPQHPDQTHPSVTPVDLSASYTFSDAHRGALTASRAWKLDATGRTVSGTTTIRNDAAKVARVVDIEVIPKSIATNVASLTFSRPPTHVIQSDPVVEFTVAVRPHSKVAIHWDARLASTAQPTLLSRAAAAKKSAEKALTTSRLRTLGQRWGFRAASVVPFATRRDPGLTTTTPPATPSPRGSATATST